MPVIRITDGHDDRLADYAGVRDPARLKARDLLIVEGRLVVRRLLESNRVDLRSLLLNDAALHAFEDIVQRVAPTHDVYVGSPEVITTATGFDMHRGCLALAGRPAVVPLSAVIDRAPFVVVLERVADPDNIGSVFRCAEAFGVDAVLLSPGCSDPFYRKAIRTSSGAALVIPSVAAAPWPDALDTLRAAGFRIVATTPGADAVDIGAYVDTAALAPRLAVMLGTEGQGLTDDALARADVRIRIPMVGQLDSLNIATAAGIVLHRLHEARQRGRGGSTSINAQM